VAGLGAVRGWIRLRRGGYLLLLAAGLGLFLTYVVTSPPAGAWASLRVETVPAAAGSALTPLTGGPDLDGFSTFAPDGKQIAFMRNGQIWLMDPSGARPKALVHDPDFWDAAPAWRRDGGQIAFVRFPIRGSGAGISARVVVADPVTGVVKEVAREQQPIGYVTYGADGKSLYYTTLNALIQLDLQTLQSKQVLLVKQGWEMISGGLCLSPDGKSLVFGAGPTNDRRPAYDLWRLDLTKPGAQPEPLTRNGGIMPAFDRTGRRLAYRNPRESTGIYLMEVGSGKAVQVLSDTPQAMYFHPAFTPDGRHLAVSELMLADPSRNDGPAGAKFRSRLHLLALPE